NGDVDHDDGPRHHETSLLRARTTTERNITDTDLPLSVPHDARELVGVEAGAAHEGTVDVGLGHEFGGVGGLHRTAVLDAHRRSRILAVESSDLGTDRGDRRLRVTGRCRAPRADGP